MLKFIQVAVNKMLFTACKTHSFKCIPPILPVNSILNKLELFRTDN